MSFPDFNINKISQFLLKDTYNINEEQIFLFVNSFLFCQYLPYHFKTNENFQTTLEKSQVQVGDVFFVVSDCEEKYSVPFLITYAKKRTIRGVYLSFETWFAGESDIFIPAEESPLDCSFLICTWFDVPLNQNLLVRYVTTLHKEHITSVLMLLQKRLSGNKGFLLEKFGEIKEQEEPVWSEQKLLIPFDRILITDKVVNRTTLAFLGQPYINSSVITQLQKLLARRMIGFQKNKRGSILMELTSLLTRLNRFSHHNRFSHDDTQIDTLIAIFQEIELHEKQEKEIIQELESLSKNYADYLGLASEPNIWQILFITLCKETIDYDHQFDGPIDIKQMVRDSLFQFLTWVVEEEISEEEFNEDCNVNKPQNR